MLSSAPYTIIFYLILLFFLINTKKIFIGFSPLVLVMFYFLYIAGSRNYAIIYLQNNNLNISLQNGLINIHPLLIYYLYANIMQIWILIYLRCNYSRFDITTSYLYSIIIVALIGIYLGGMWANQELNWGGVWSWDPVEIISLVGVLFIIKILHNRPNLVASKKVLLYIIIVWLFYMIIRLGVINSIHSFIRSNNAALYVNSSIILIALYYSKHIATTLSKGYSFSYSHVSKYLYNSQITVLFLYTYIYILYLVASNKLVIDFISLSNFFILFFYFILLYYIIIFSCSPSPKRKLIYLYTIAFIYGIVTINMSILFIFFFYVNKISVAYSTAHLLCLHIYNIYFVFTTNIPVHKSKIITILNIFNINKSSTLNGPNNLYETIFFLKRSWFIMKLKSFVAHINGFNIFANFVLSTYLFSKNFLIKPLFSIDLIYITLFLNAVFIGTFLKVSPIKNHKAINNLIY